MTAAAAGVAPTDVIAIDDADAAAAVLDPLRARILAELREPGSATTVAAALDLPRQKVNYHLRTLEALGFVRLVEERPRRGLTERVVVASARAYVVAPSALGELGTDPARADRLSSAYLVAVAGRLMTEVATLARAADEAAKPLSTMTIDTDIRFASPDSRAAFLADLSDAVLGVVARHHDESAADGRWHRLVVAAHPRPDQEVDHER